MITIADTLRDIANESSLNPAEKESLRQIAKKVSALLAARMDILIAFKEWDDEVEPEINAAAKSRNKGVRAYARLKKAHEGT